MPRKTIADLRAAPPQLRQAQRAALIARTPAEIDAAAATDPINPEWPEERLERAAFARDVRQAREATGLTQAAFANRYRIALARLRDWEQGRFRPDTVAAAYVTIIRHDPAGVARALAVQSSGER